jgi:hypothetical protein
MRSSHTLDAIAVTFDDEHLVADAGMIQPATLAQHLGLRELFDTHVDLGAAAGRANVGHKAMTIIHSALAGGDSIDDCDALRAGASEAALGHAVLAPSTLGTFLRGFTWGHARQLDKVSGLLLGRAWAAGAGPGTGPVTIDIDSSIHETYGLHKQGGAKFTHTKVRGYHPLYAVIAGTGDIVHSRLRGGNANTGRGAAGFCTETFNRVRAAGATGPLTLRADAGFYIGKVAEACRTADVRYSITVKMNPAIRKAIDTITADDWVAIPYFLDGADVAETTYRPFAKKAPVVRLIVRRVKPTPGSQLALFTTYRYHAMITDREGGTVELEADHRRHAVVEDAIRDLKYGVGLDWASPRRADGRLSRSRSIRSCAFSARSSARSDRSSVVSPSRSPRSIRSRPTQFPSVPAFTPIARAASAIDRDSSSTIATAVARRPVRSRP